MGWRFQIIYILFLSKVATPSETTSKDVFQTPLSSSSVGFLDKGLLIGCQWVTPHSFLAIWCGEIRPKQHNVILLEIVL